MCLVVPVGQCALLAPNRVAQVGKVSFWCGDHTSAHNVVDKLRNSVVDVRVSGGYTLFVSLDSCGSGSSPALNTPGKKHPQELFAQAVQFRALEESCVEWQAQV